VRCVPDQFALADRSQFSDAEPTGAQHREWVNILSAYARRLMANRHREFTIPVLAEAMGLGERQAATLAKDGRDAERDPADYLAEDILYAMRDGKIAGVLGTRHGPEAELVFKLVSQTEPRSIRGDKNEFRRLKDIFDLEFLAWRAKP
jgi:hypothetical protein